MSTVCVCSPVSCSWDVWNLRLTQNIRRENFHLWNVKKQHFEDFEELFCFLSLSVYFLPSLAGFLTPVHTPLEWYWCIWLGSVCWGVCESVREGYDISLKRWQDFSEPQILDTIKERSREITKEKERERKRYAPICLPTIHDFRESLSSSVPHLFPRCGLPHIHMISMYTSLLGRTSFYIIVQFAGDTVWQFSDTFHGNIKRHLKACFLCMFLHFRLLRSGY